jgi:RNase H-fold protein (predicted Holliday junction resolvase)
MNATTKNITKILTTPAKFASIFNWKKASAKVLSLEIQKGSIGLALASHPSFQEAIHKLEPIPLSKRHLADTVPQRLAEIVKNENVCGFVVSWPIQQDTGKLGYSCGLVLNTLEQILEQQTGNSEIMTSSRPVCLWDGAHAELPPMDVWGRDPKYARTSDKTLHVASRDQYHVYAPGNAPTEVMKDFFRVNWPQLHYMQPQHHHHMYNSDLDWDDHHDTMHAA